MDVPSDRADTTLARAEGVPLVRRPFRRKHWRLLAFLRDRAAVAASIVLFAVTGAMHGASIEGPGTPVPADLLRLSVGIEDPQDLIDDLDQALTG